MTFEEEINNSIKESIRLGYNPIGFKGMITQHGVVEASKRLINNPKITDGTIRLWELKRLDLTVETICQKYPHLFTKDEILRAKSTLSKLNSK
ncbi:hypothetical protein AGMMS50268_31790 [Spirochaetia bacterium]|nr:hypothetical protein AGMMS50268_31790 [Spirochaetia bacterium]